MDFAESGDNLRNKVLTTGMQALSNRAQRRQRLSSLQELKIYRNEILNIFQTSIGPYDANETPLDCSEMPDLQLGSMSIERIALHTPRGNTIPCNVYKPLIEEKPMPAILVCIGHCDDGKADPEYQRVAQCFCQLGFLTLLFDPIGEGERHEFVEPTAMGHVFQGCSAEHNLLDFQCRLAGTCLANFFLQDAICVVNYLRTRSDVDMTQIYVSGHSGGGTQATLLLSAIPEAFAGAAPCAFITSEKEMLLFGKDPDNEMILSGLLKEGIDYADLLIGILGKPILVLADNWDFFPLEGTIETVNELKRIARNCKLDDSLIQLIQADAPHSFPMELAIQAAEAFCTISHLEKTYSKTFPIEIQSEKDLSCLPNGEGRTIPLQSLTVHQTIVSVLNNRKPYQKEKAVAWLHERFDFDRLSSPILRKKIDEGLCTNLLFERIVWRNCDGLIQSMLLIRDCRYAESTVESTVCLWPGGSSAITNHSAWINKACALRKEVIILDIPLDGVSLPHPISGQDLHIGWSTLYILNASLIKMDDSLFALRMRAILQFFMDYKNREPNRKLTLYSASTHIAYAKFAALLFGICLQTEGDCPAWEELAMDRYPDMTHREELLFPDILQYMDSRIIDEWIRN